MLRTFAEHETRRVESLDGRWDFVTAQQHASRTRLPRRYDRTIQVPGCWEQLPGLEAYRGKAWYRTTFTACSGLAVRLVFGGVSHTADVFVDGRRVGHHYDAFTPFDVVVPGLSAGEHELVVEVDNSFGPHSALHIENDYYTYGGITRPVELQLVPPVYVDKLFALPVRKGGRWGLDVRVRLANWGRKAASRRVVLLVGQEVVEAGEAVVPPGATAEVSTRVNGLDVEPWSPANPALYDVAALLLVDDRELSDDLIDRVGFREVKVRGRKLLLNGESIRLRGYNRHEDHPQFGCALPAAAMTNDLEILRDLGCNFIRTCHYPNDMRFLDLCDELGVCVWEESHARDVSFAHPKFREQIACSTREMIEWHYNRPSIVIWGCLNECDSDTPAGRKVHAEVIGQIRSLDASRPVTFASNKGEKDLCMDLVDIVSWNRYDGWYGGAIDSSGPMLARLLKWLGSPAGKGAGKPVLLSEFGAGAIPGYRAPHHAKWTEEYQAEVLDEMLGVYLNHPAVVGAAIWQFCDIRVSPTKWYGRPRTMNNKGTVDENRRPKLAYAVVKRRMHEAIRRWDRKKK
ncbi:MAG TPA: beta-glucuronidase [Phycisphaerales bacterium]|nr:beta-glucuronidase [Phycisphaerales bacterium]